MVSVVVLDTMDLSSASSTIVKLRSKISILVTLTLRFTESKYGGEVPSRFRSRVKRFSVRSRERKVRNTKKGLGGEVKYQSIDSNWS